MSWTPDLVIYHDHCTDGFGAAWACWMRWRDGCKYIPASYGSPPPNVAGKNVLIVDFSYKRAILDEMLQSTASVVVLDHHKTAQTDLEPFQFHESSPGAISANDVGGMVRDLVELGRPACIAIFDMNRSGARLAWDFCHPGKRIPKLIHLIEDRDLWHFQYEETKPFSLWLRSEPFDFNRFEQIEQDIEVPYGNAIMREAEAMQRFFDAKVAEIASFAKCRRIGDHDPIVVNCPPMFASEVGHALLDAHPAAPFAATYFDGPNTRMWSLRSRNDREDVAAIAAKFGGGGHRNAAGFGVPLP